MRVFFAYFLAFIILLLSAQELLVIGVFKICQDNIAATQCVYKFDSEVMCQGSCVLADQLEANHEASQPKDLFFQITFTSKVFYTLSIFPMLSLPEITLQQDVFLQKELGPSLFASSIFHPPRCMA